MKKIKKEVTLNTNKSIWTDHIDSLLLEIKSK